MTASRTSSFLKTAFLAAVLVALPPALGIGQARADEHIKGSGVVRTEARAVTGFHAIALEVPATVTIRQGAGEGLSIKSDDNVVPLVETVVENGTLRIRWARRNLSMDLNTFVIVVDAKSLDALAIHGSGEVRAAQLKSANLHVAVDGSGSVALDALDTDALSVAIHGNGRLVAAGRTDALDVAISGSGQVKAPKLQSRRARITLNGSAQATVWAQDDLNATIAGSGEVRYYGKPRLTQTVAGSGTIRPAGAAS